MDLYYGRMSGNSARAVLGTFESGAACELHVLDTKNGMNRSLTYLAVNPMGKIPAFVDGDFKLWESNAINWYLAEKFPAAKLLPASPQGRASVQRWLFFQAAHVSPACIPVFRATNPRIMAFFNVTPDLPAAEKGRTELARFLPVIEQALSGRDWLEGEFSLADVAYAPHLISVADGGFDFAQYPRVKAWIDRLASRPAWRRVAETVYGG